MKNGLLERGIRGGSLIEDYWSSLGKKCVIFGLVSRDSSRNYLSFLKN